MFYVLNFTNHEFKSCNTTNEAKNWLQAHEDIDEDYIEIINGFIEGVRISAKDFLDKNY